MAAFPFLVLEAIPISQHVQQQDPGTDTHKRNAAKIHVISYTCVWQVLHENVFFFFQKMLYKVEVNKKGGHSITRKIESSR